MHAAPLYYESDDALAQYLWLHYASDSGAFPFDSAFCAAMDFPKRCVAELIAPEKHSLDRALDLGCAVGRSTFELARMYGEAIGIDFSSRFIDAAARLQRGESMEYALPIQGELKQRFVARVPVDVDTTRVRFEVGDAMNLRGDLGSFDLVFAANLLCRLSEPKRLLDQLPALVKAGGRLVLTTPSTWKQIYTPRENWLGGFEGESGPVRTLDGLKKILTPAFVLEKRSDLPLLIREHERKFEFIVAEGTVWRRS